MFIKSAILHINELNALEFEFSLSESLALGA